MTHASISAGRRHDTLASVTSKSGRGTARQTIRVDEDTWEKFGTRSQAAGTDRSTVLREFIRWYNREPGTRAPKRPD